MIDEYNVLMVIRRLALVGKTVDNMITLNKAVMRDLIKMGIADSFDEAWYLDRYNDVAEAVRKGAISSGLDHYASAGVYEGRIPYPFAIDEKDYLDRHRDVARSLSQGLYGTAADHFYAVGFVEGRGFKIVPEEATPPAVDSAAGTEVESATP